MENASLVILKKCEVSNEIISECLKLSTDFIIDQKLVKIDSVSEFSGGAFAKVIRASYVYAEVRVKRFHAILCSGEEGPNARVDLHRFLQECRLAQTLRHPNIVHFYGVVMDGNSPMLVMEPLVCTLYDFLTESEKYAAAKDVFEPPHTQEDQPRSLAIDNTPVHSLEPAESNTVTAMETSQKDMSRINASASNPQQSELSDEAVKSKLVVHTGTIKHIHKVTIALNIAQGLHYLHTKKPFPIVHRDLSSRNILLGTISRKFVAKIGDFGQSKEIKHKNDWSSTNPGTLQYLPPEVLVFDSAQELTESKSLLATINRDQVPQRETQSDGRLPADQLPIALEPDDVITATSTVTQLSSRPLLKSSLDMYMYGVLMVELASQQAPHKWREDDCKESWLNTHKRKTESLNRDSILYKVAKKCILEHPDKRLSASEVVNMIMSTFPRPTSGGSFNEELMRDRELKDEGFLLISAANVRSSACPPEDPERRTFFGVLKSLFKTTPEKQSELKRSMTSMLSL